MLFKDYVTSLSNQNEKLSKMHDIIDELEEVIKLDEYFRGQAFKYGYLGLTSSNMSSSYISNGQSFTNISRTTYTKIRETLIGIDFMEFGEILSNFGIAGIDTMDDKIGSLINDFKQSYKIIHNYRKQTVDQAITANYIECINAIKNMIYIFNKFEYLVDNIKFINEKLCESIEGDGLEIQLLDYKLTNGNFDTVIDPVYIIYDKLCEIANVKEELVIARVETGSFFAKFLGNASILKLLAKILGTVHDIGVRNFTREGKKKNIAESTELLSQQINILKEMKDMGFDVSEHEEIARETIGMIIKQSNILLSSSPDIIINEKTLSKSQDFKRLISNENYKLLAVTEDVEEMA